MAQQSLRQRLEILADAAKYDASCASSGTAKKNSLGGKGVGSTEGMGICHAYAPDGRCISLLKILLTNHCIFDCHYCINRKSANTPRARFTPQEVVDLTLNFYRRNYIEGLFLSSGIVKSANRGSCARSTTFAAISTSRPSPRRMRRSSMPQAFMLTACRSMSNCPPMPG
jgi:predicted DNA-binding helix-hairpin-helix protein